MALIAAKPSKNKIQINNPRVKVGMGWGYLAHAKRSTNDIFVLVL